MTPAGPPPEGAILLTAREVGTMLACGPDKVMQLARAGDLQVMVLRPGHVPGKAKGRPGRAEYRFGRADVERYVRERLGFLTAPAPAEVRVSVPKAAKALAAPPRAAKDARGRWVLD